MFSAIPRPIAIATLLLVLASAIYLPSNVCAAEPGPDSTQIRERPATKPAAAQWRQTKIRLGQIPPPGADETRPLLDQHGRHYGLVLKDANGERLWLDGQTQPRFDKLATNMITDAYPPYLYVYSFSADGKHLAYPVHERGKMRMVLDCRAGPEADDVGTPLFSEDGNHLAYVAKRDGKSMVFVDGVSGPVGDRIVGQSVGLSPDGKRSAYVVERDKRQFLVIDQKEQSETRYFSSPLFSPDGKRFGYMTRNSGVVDGVKGPELPDVGTWQQPVFSTDSRHFAYSMTGHSERTMACIDHRQLPLPNGGIGVWYLEFSPNLQRWACILGKGCRGRVVLDGKIGEEMDWPYSLKFSPDNQRFVYTAESNGGCQIIVDGKPEAEIDLDWSQPIFSPNGKRLAYIAGRGPMWWVMADGKPGPQFKGFTVKRDNVLSLRSEMEWAAVTPPVFSPDSEHVAYGAYVDGLWHVVLDGDPQDGEYDKITFGGPSFRDDGVLEFLGIRNKVLYRVTMERAAPNRK